MTTENSGIVNAEWQVKSQAPREYAWDMDVDGVKYHISNDKCKIDYSFMSKMFESDQVYWCGAMREDDIRVMVENSCSLGLYAMKSQRIEANRNIQQNTIEVPVQIGFGRLVTDYATIAYLTDVYIDPQHQGNGVGKWLIACVKEIIDSLPALRRAVLLTQVNGRGVKFYERELGMRLCDPTKDAYGFMEYAPLR